MWSPSAPARPSPRASGPTAPSCAPIRRSANFWRRVIAESPDPVRHIFDEATKVHGAGSTRTIRQQDFRIPMAQLLGAAQIVIRKCIMTYDLSTDYARYPTLAPLPVEKLFGCADYVSCPGCGGKNFLLCRRDGKLLCARCGRVMEYQTAPITALSAEPPAAPIPRKAVHPRIQISSLGTTHYILTPTGTVKAIQFNFNSCAFEECTHGKYGECNVQNWSGITAVASGTYHCVGLRSDGTVLAVGNNYAGECDLKGWRGITAIAAGADRSFGLCADGTVRAAGYNLNGACNVKTWSDITAIASGLSHTVGLCSNGTVKAVGDNGKGQCNVQNWSDITAIAAGHQHTVGLRSNGTVVAVGRNCDGECKVQDWTDIISIAPSGFSTVGLCKDGTIRLSNQNYSNKAALYWRDIVSIQTLSDYVVGMQSDGTYLCTNNDIQIILNNLPR